MAAGLLSFGMCYGAILCSVSVPGSLWDIRAFPRERSFVFLCFSGVSMVWVPMSHEPPQIALRAFKPGPYPKDLWCSPCLHAQPPLAAGGCEHLSCFSAVIAVCMNSVVIFFLSVMLPSEIPKFPTDPNYERISYCVETSPPSWLPPQDESLSLNPFSLLLSFIFCPTSFQRDRTHLPLYTFPICLSECLVSSANIQKLICRSCSTFKWSFDVFVGEKVVSPYYSSTIFHPVSF